MAVCGTCGKELPDDVWSCGSCGAPISRAAYSPASAGYVADSYAPATYTPQPDAVGGRVPQTTAGTSRTLVTVLVLAVVAIIAIIAVWFFLLRTTPGGQEFLGTWTGLTQRSGGITIAKPGGDFQITLLSPQGGTAGPFKGSLDDGKLEIKLEAATGDATTKAVAAIMKSYADTALGGGRLVLSVRPSDGHLLLTITGKTPDGTPVDTQAAEWAPAAVTQ
jgi:hypothetical protein